MVNISLPNMQILAEMLQQGRWYYYIMTYHLDYTPINSVVTRNEHVLIDVEEYTELFGISPMDDEDNIHDNIEESYMDKMFMSEDLNECIEEMVLSIEK